MTNQADFGLRHGEGTITPRLNKDGTTVYEVRWREPQDDGTIRRRAKTYRTSDDAEDALRDIARAKRDGRFTPSPRQTVQQVVDAWMERGKAKWKASTYATYQQRAKRHVYPRLGGQIIESLTTPQLQGWVDSLRRSGLDASTIEGAVQVLVRSLNEAVRIGLLPHNPASGLSRPPVKIKQIPTWTTDEVRHFMDAIGGDPFWRALYLFALNTGARPGEVRAVQWQDVDRHRGLVRIRRTMTKDAEGRVVIGDTTKTGRHRAVALPRIVFDALATWRDAQMRRRDDASEWHDLDLIFDRGDGLYLPLTTWQHHHERFTRMAGVRHITPHQLRHTNATLDLEAGISPKIVAERLGHRNIQTTLDRYSHVSIDLQQSAAEAFANRLFGMAPDTTTSTLPEAISGASDGQGDG